MNRIVSLLTAASLMFSSGCTAGEAAVSPDSSEDTAITASDTAQAQDTAAEILASMTLEEKVGQMFFVRYTDDETILDDIEQYKMGGLILFAKDFEERTPEGALAQINACQSVSDIPLLMGVDEEGGLVNRVSKFSQFREEPFKSPQELYAEGGFELIASDTDEKCALLTSLGINVNLAPVCDVSEDSSSFIYDRTLGQDAALTSEYVKTVVTEMKKNGMISALKHFPGYGGNGDTHTDIITDTRELEVFENSDFLPFKAGIGAGADMVLVSHNIVTAMDSQYPASLSPAVHEILRNELGFDGVIMTDDMSMGAITEYTDGKAAAVQAVKAGNDLICCTDYTVQIPAVIEAVKGGEISEEQINASVMRILLMKINSGIIDTESVK